MKKLVNLLFILFILLNFSACKENTVDKESYTFTTISGFFNGIYNEGELGNYTISFSGDIKDDFSFLSIGKGYKGPLGNYLYIDNSVLEVRNNSDDQVIDTCTHNIDFKDSISIQLLANNNDTVNIKIASGSDKFEVTMNFSSNYGKLFVYTDGLLTNCNLSYDCIGWDKDIWLFGDSYFSNTSKESWVSYINNDNILLDAWSGRVSKDALVSLKHCLQYNTPKLIIWCMGMNDGDVDGINADWLESLNEVVEICNTNNIELIVTTIPTNPYWNNDYKNEYIKNSGLRYIDFAGTVGSYENITWYDGMLEEGEPRIHPTELGAKELYECAISEVPMLEGK